MVKLRDLLGLRSNGERNGEKIDEAAEMRKRLSYLRIADSGVAEAVAYFTLVAGNYVEGCRAAGLYDPVANDAFRDTLDVVTAYLRELDEESTERRFDVHEGAPNLGFGSRVALAVRENARIVKEKLEAITGGIPPTDTLDIREELK
jgi:hypothetical protein